MSLEVNGMHVLHRPHLPKTVAVTVGAAVLAIVLTLAIASRLNDLGFAPAPRTGTSPPAALNASATRPEASMNPFVGSPFSSPLTTRVLQPWAPPLRVTGPNGQPR